MAEAKMVAKVQKHALICEEINNLYEEERNSHYDDIINKIQDSSGQFFEKESPASE